MDTNKFAQIEKHLNTHYVGAKLNSHIYIFKKPIVNSKGDRVRNIARNINGTITAFVKFKHVREYANFPFQYLDNEMKELIYNEMVNN